MIELQGLEKRFGSFVAVHDVSLQVERGEVLGFLGPNGAGKSTTMKMVAGFLRPTRGRAAICGADVVADPVAAKRHLGYLPEGAPCYPDMTAAGFLSFIARIRGFDGAEAMRRIGLAVERTQLSSVLHQPIETLSKGFKRRVGLAQALLHDPDVLILDEPTDGLDPNQKHEVRELIRSMAAAKAIVISTHILEEVDAVCSRAVVIAQGRILVDETPQALAARAIDHNAVRIRLAAAPGAALLDALRADAAVARVEQPEPMLVTVMPVNGQAIADRVGALLVGHGAVVRELSVEQGRLDDVFRAITRPRDANAPESSLPASSFSVQ
ncbi:MAG: ABC transporter ATP-binding protein [Azospirillaceae bacterium]|nr:ABC transporter ATP-binding protein [Azospirillaceae bacterium]